MKAEFYSVMAVLYYGLAGLQDQHYAPLYQDKAHIYVDSILMYSPPESYQHMYYRGLRHVRKAEFDEGLANITMTFTFISDDFDPLFTLEPELIAALFSPSYISRYNTFTASGPENLLAETK